jgi:hypothetical protein
MNVESNMKQAQISYKIGAGLPADINPKSGLDESPPE